MYLLAFNLMRLLVEGYKVDNNIKKFKNLFRFSDYSCDVLNLHKSSHYNNIHLHNIANQITQNINKTMISDVRNPTIFKKLNNRLIINGKNYLKKKYYDNLNTLSTQMRANKKDCNVVIGSLVPHPDIQYIFNGKDSNSVNDIEKKLGLIAFNVDVIYGHTVFIYSTGDIYKNVNLYNVYINNKLSIDWNKGVWSSFIQPRDVSRVLHGGKYNIRIIPSILNDAIGYDTICRNLDDAINDFHQSL
jgi:hypothetical protein